MKSNDLYKSVRTSFVKELRTDDGKTAIILISRKTEDTCKDKDFNELELSEIKFMIGKSEHQFYNFCYYKKIEEPKTDEEIISIVKNFLNAQKESSENTIDELNEKKQDIDSKLKEEKKEISVINKSLNHFAVRE